jgi:hypothetical protein
MSLWMLLTAGTMISMRSTKAARNGPECHTLRNERGELRHEVWLSGAPIWIQPVAKIPNWADRVPALAGFPSLTEEQAE